MNKKRKLITEPKESKALINELKNYKWIHSPSSTHWAIKEFFDDTKEYSKKYDKIILDQGIGKY